MEMAWYSYGMFRSKYSYIMLYNILLMIIDYYSVIVTICYNMLQYYMVTVYILGLMEKLVI